MSNEQPPSSEHAEKAVIGAIIKDPKLLDKIIAWIKSPDGFWYTVNRRIWLTILDLEKKEIGIDPITIVNRYSDKFKEDINIQDITKCIELGNNVDNAEFHAKIVWERYVQREVLKVSKRLEVASRTNNANMGTLLTQHQRYMEELANLQPTKDNSFISVANRSTNTILEGAHIVEWGEKHLDDYAGGLTRGEFTVLGGRPGNGKTTLMVNMIDSLAIRNPKLKISVFNREMTNTSALSKLLILNSSKLTTSTFRKRHLETWEKDEIIATKERLLKKYPNLRLYDDIDELDQTMREIKRYSPDIVFDDYVQLIKVNGKRSRDRRFEIEDIVNEYKWILKRTNATGILLSQLSRDIEKRLDNTPTMADYAEGGTLEQGAETCMFVYFPYYFDPHQFTPFENQIIIKKARYGAIGTYKVGFSGKHCRFFIPSQRVKELSNEL